MTGSAGTPAEPAGQEVIEAAEAIGRPLPEPARRLLTEDPEAGEAIAGVMASVSYQGPVPPPQMVAGYEDVLPGAAERLFQMAERQLNHDMHMEEKEFDLRANIALRSQWIAAVVVLVIVLAGSGLILAGKSAQGLALILAQAAIVIGIILNNRRRSASDPQAPGGRTNAADPHG